MIRWMRKILGKDSVDLIKHPETTEAARAVRQAEEARRTASEHTGEIAVLSQRLNELRRDNHFATLIRSAVLGEDKP